MKLADYVINALADLTFHQILLVIDIMFVAIGIPTMFIILWRAK